MAPDSVPYRCPVCVSRPGACGASGELLYGTKRAVPTCKHNEPPGKPCHEAPVKMEPSRG